MIYDFRSGNVSCDSLGNIVVQGLCMEWIRKNVDRDAIAIPSQFYAEIWDLFIDKKPTPLNESDERVKVTSRYHDGVAMGLSWVEIALFEMGYLLEGRKFDPRIVWKCDPDSRTALIYPREWDNKNLVFTLDYWIDTCHKAIKLGYKLAVVLQTSDHRRDTTVPTSKWAGELLKNVPFYWVFPNTIGGLQAGVGVSSIAIGRATGPGWMLMKSDINQVILDDPGDLHNCKFSYHAKRGVFAKSVQCFEGATNEWLQDILSSSTTGSETAPISAE